MGSMLELERTVEELKKEIDIQKSTNTIVFSMLIQTLNQISHNHNVREVLMLVLDEIKPKYSNSLPAIDEAFTRVEKIISKK